MLGVRMALCVSRVRVRSCYSGLGRVLCVRMALWYPTPKPKVEKTHDCTGIPGESQIPSIYRRTVNQVLGSYMLECLEEKLSTKPREESFLDISPK